MGEQAGNWRTIAPGVQGRAGAADGLLSVTTAGSVLGGRRPPEPDRHRRLGGGRRRGLHGDEPGDERGDEPGDERGDGRGEAGTSGARRTGGDGRPRGLPRPSARLVLLAVSVVVVTLIGLATVPKPLPGASDLPPGGSYPGASSQARAPGTPLGPAASDRPGPVAEADWWAILGALDARRTLALASGDADLLATYAVPGFQAWRADSALLEQMAASGWRPVGLATRLVAIEDVAVGRGRASQSAGDGERAEGGQPADGDGRADGVVATLTVVDERSGYRMVDSSGATVDEVPASGRRRWHVELVHGASAPEEVSVAAEGTPVTELPGVDGWLVRASEPVP